MRTVLGVALLVALGLAARLFSLQNVGGFDFDEIVSYEYAELPLVTMVRTVAERTFEHPPFYYALLHLWFTLPLERSDAFVRLLSVAFGTLAIPGAFLLARRVLRSVRAAMLTTLLVAVAPLEVYFSREARMYSLLVLLSVLSLWLLLRALERGRWWWALYGVVTLLALYTHFIALAVVLAQNIYVLWVWRRSPLPLFAFVALQAVVVAAHLPLVAMATGLTASMPALGTGSLSVNYLVEITRETVLGFVVGLEEVVRARWATALTAILWLVALGGSARLARHGAGLLLATLVVGALVALAALIAIDKDFQVRYLIVLHVPFLMVVAYGIEGLRSWRWWLAAGGLAAASALPLIPYYFDYQRGDYEQITQRIELLAKTGDEVVLTGPWQERYWCYFSAKNEENPGVGPGIASGCRQATLHELFVHRIPLTVPPPLGPAQADQVLQFIYDVHGPTRLWFVQAGLAQADPNNYVERWLTVHAWQGDRRAYRNGVLSLWAVADAPMTRVTPTQMRVGDAVAVDWYEFESNPRAGSVLRTTFGLRLLHEIDYDIRLSLRLQDGRGEFVQRDVFVGHPHHPTRTWEVGETVEFRAGITTPPGAKPGAYALGAIFYVDADPPLPIVRDGRVQADSPHLLGEVELQRNPPQVVDPDVTPHRIAVRFADPQKDAGSEMIALEGYGIGQTTLSPLDRLNVLLVWRALQNIDAQLIAELRLVDAAGIVAWESQRVVGDETYRVDRWINGDFVRDWYIDDLSPTLPAGAYDLQLRVLKPAARAGEEQVEMLRADGSSAVVALGQVRIAPQDVTPERPPLWQRALRRLWREVTQ